jgi:hypothetical protein
VYNNKQSPNFGNRQNIPAIGERIMIKENDESLQRKAILRNIMAKQHRRKNVEEEDLMKKKILDLRRRSRKEVEEIYRKIYKK